MKNNLKLLTLVFLCTIQNAFSQSPWTKDKGKAYVQLGFSTISYNQAQIKGETVELGADFSDVTIQLYSEYGISDKLQATLILPFKTIGVSATAFTNSRSYSGLGNISLGLKYKFFDQDWKISGGLQYSPKTSKFDDTKGLGTGFDASTILPYITAGTSSGKWYYFGNIGYGYMDNDFSDFFRLNAEVGYNVIPKGHVILALDTRNIVSKESAYLNNQKQWPSNLDRQTYNALGLKLNYEFTQDKLGANLAVFGAFGNDNAPLAPSLNLGLYTKF